MPITVQCTSCSSRITAPDRLAGKTAKCPKCSFTFVLPSPDPGFEVIEDDEPVIARPKRKPPAADPGFLVVEDDRPERPKPKKLPRKRYVEDDDVFLPRRRSSAGSAASHTRLFILLAGGLAFLAVLVGGVYFAIDKVKTAPTETTPSSVPLPPPEWKTFAPPKTTFSVSLPGIPTASKESNIVGAGMQTWELTDGIWEYKIVVVTIPKEIPGDQFLDQLTELSTSQADKDPGVVESPSTLGKIPARQFAFVEGEAHTMLRTAIVENRAYVFVVICKDKPLDPKDDEVRKFFDSVSIQ